MRESFIFYKSFYDSIKELDPKDQVRIYDAIFKYQFENKKIELESIPKIIFTLILPQLEANNKRYENGKKGGAPKGNKNASKTTKKQPKNNQKTTKKQPNVNVNDNVNVNVNDINNSSSSNIYKYIEENFGRLLGSIELQKVDMWIQEYKEEIIKYAIQIATLNNKKTFNYVNGILNNWKSAGYTTLKEIKENEIKKEENQDIYEYDWLNEEN